jgi:non-ribosomal peptide synthetase component E (peptide arylation enzyme)
LLALHDATRSSVLALVLVPGGQSDTTLARVREHLAGAFDGWLPDHLTELADFPYTPSAKVQKHLLRQRLSDALRPVA